jgi:hypothetical protein
MHWRLRYETIRKRKTDNATDEAGTSKQKKIPMEAGRFLEGILTGLCGKGGNVL